jgi:hypothetical protein
VAEKLSAVVERLASLAPDPKIDWSDPWSYADLHDFTTAAARRQGSSACLACPAVLPHR